MKRKLYSKLIKNPQNDKDKELVESYRETKGPLPPTKDLNYSKSYWLTYPDYDGRPGDHLCVRQWQPSAKQWCHVGDFATGRNCDMTGYVVIGELPLPPKFIVEMEYGNTIVYSVE